MSTSDMPTLPPVVPVRCPACGPLIPGDVKPAPFVKAYLSLLKDWRTWALAVGVFLVVGLICGALNLQGSAVGAGGGAVLGLVLASRTMALRQCGLCGAIAR